MRNWKPLMNALLGGTCSLAILAAQTIGQEPPSKQRSQAPSAADARATATTKLQLPPDQPVVELTVQAPAEVHVGHSFNYQIRVQNNSKNIAVHDLVIAQLADKSFEIESAEVQGEPSPQQTHAAGQQSQPSSDKPRQGKQTAQADDQVDKQPKSDNEKASDQPTGQKRESESEQSQSTPAEGSPSSDNSPQSDSSAGNNASQEEDKKADAEKDADQPSDETDTDQADGAAANSGDHSKSEQSRGLSTTSERSPRQSQQATADSSRWKIDRLMPGESRTIIVTASSDSEGGGNVCVVVESYMPALCLTTRFTKPELEIVKQAPEVADICNDITFAYLVRNTGTGDLQQFTVRDELPEGLQTVDGAKNLEFTLDDGLKAGGTRKFEARLRATRTGDFTSRATVEGSEGVEARSNRAGTKVQKADLALAIEGPRAQEVGALANYTVRVTNRGDAPAPAAQLRVYFPRSADLVRAGQPQPSSTAVEAATAQASGSAAEQASHQHESPSATQEASERDAENAGESEGQKNAHSADRANQDAESQQKQQEQQPNDQESDQDDDDDDDQQKSDSHQQSQAQREQQASGDARDQARRAQNLENQERRNMAQHHWQLGTLAPGQTVEVTYVLRPYEGGELEQAAVAEYACATAQDREMLRAETETTTEILMLTGLRLTVIDDHDPVSASQNVTYSIAVLNQGNAPAHNVKILAKLPKELKFVEAKGVTSGENSEESVNFEPLETLEAGKQAVWQLVASVNEGVGDKTQDSIQVTLDSDDLEETIVSEEPTTFFEAEKKTARSSDSEAEATEKK